MIIANSASMIDHFNRDNIAILEDLGYEIIVAANFHKGNSSTDSKIKAFYDELIERHITVIDLPVPRKVTGIGATIKSIKILKNFLASTPCDLIHTQTPFGGVVGRLAAKKQRKAGKTKVIYFVHGFHFFKGSGIKSWTIYYTLEKYLTKFTDILITLNKEDYNFSLRKFKNLSIKYVPGIGVNTNKIADISIDRDAKLKSLHLPTDKHIILNVSELIPRKNVADSIKAFANSNRGDAILVICGKGDGLDELKALANDLGVSNSVYFLGYRTDILEIYSISDLFLFSSRQEGLSVAVMQAMATGIPAVISDIRGNRDLLLPDSDRINEPFLIKQGDISAYSSSINTLLDDALYREKVGRTNYNNCRKYFDLKTVHQLMLEIYKEV